MNNRFTSALVLIITLSTGLSAQVKINPSTGFTLENKYARYVFEPVGMGLSAMIDLETGYNHIDPVNGKHLIWKVVFGKGTQRPAIDNNYKPCSFGSVTRKSNGDQVVILEWNDLRFWEEDSICSVRVTIELPEKDAVAKWKISVSNHSDYWGLWEVACPSVNGFPAAGRYNIAIPVTGSGGHLLKNWQGSFKRRSPSGFFPMQFMSFNNDTGSVYFSSMDGESRAKDFYFDSEVNELSLIRYPENMGIAGSDLPGYYAVAFGPFQGGWLEAAYRYREWALQQVWTARGPISQRPDFPEIATNVGFWVRDTWVWDLPPDVDKDTGDPFSWRRDERDPHEMNLPFLNAMKRMDVPIAFQWYGWHHVLFDNEYPHFLPPLKGFKERVAELVDSGALIVPYINALSADSKIPDWDKFDPHAIKDESGGLRQKFYRDGAGRLTPMCPNQNFWHYTINNLVDSIINVYGANGIYMDEISCNSHELCFNPDHRHPLGGGRYWADGYRNLYRKTLNIAHQSGKDIVITSESANEIFYDLVTANLFTGRPTDYEIPMLQTVYSGYTLFYASRCDFRKSDLLFNFSVGQGFIDGRQIGWMDFDLFRPQYDKKVEYMKNCAKYRMVTKKYLVFGRLWEPVYPDNEVPFFEEEFVGGGRHTGHIPGAEARLWQAEDGSIAIFMANYFDREIPFSFTIDPGKYGLKASTYQVTEISPEGNLPISKTGGTISRTEVLGPNRVKVIEFAPVK
ncbi:MAG: hypothetical protein AMS26_22545 [Bacteroides sp. SM23_62]|nr:MAG: hypothetical protein AMS26_22545 [Bacteroides sp. SM23_62]